MEKVDLHLHSNNSDGSDNINELIKYIIENNIKIFSLTDHDTVAGCEKMEKATPDSVKYIKGIELTCTTEDIKCHILGYGCNPKNETLLSLIEKGKILRKKKLDTRIEYLKNVWNIEFTKEELDWLATIPSVVKTHLGVILVKRGLAKNNLEAMSKYLDDCKTGNTRFTIPEAINAITASGGIPIWAHPLGGEGETHITKEEFLRQLKKMIKFGIKGLECYYSRYNKKEIDLLINTAKENNLLISAGSDYHGKNKTVQIGRLCTEDIEFNYDDITLLKALGY